MNTLKISLIGFLRKNLLTHCKDHRTRDMNLLQFS